MNPLYPAVAARADHRCEFCHAPESVFNFPFEVEHIVPSAHGGGDDLFNLALSCRGCNLHKSNHEHGIDSITGETVRLFHPRQDRWEDHFRIKLDVGEIEGLTPYGRATVLRLNLNSLAQIDARRQWVRLGVFP